MLASGARSSIRRSSVPPSRRPAWCSGSGRVRVDALAGPPGYGRSLRVIANDQRSQGRDHAGGAGGVDRRAP